MRARRTRRHGFTLMEMMIVIGVIAILITSIVPRYAKSRRQSKLSACKQNLRNMAAALESYATDNNGLYPQYLQQLTVPAKPYIKTLPICQECGGESSYTTGYESAENPNTFTVRCKGEYHTACGVEPDFPMYTPTRGGSNSMAEFEGEG